MKLPKAIVNHIHRRKLKKETAAIESLNASKQFEGEIGRELAKKYKPDLIPSKKHLVSLPVDLHPDTVNTILELTSALGEKLYAAQIKHGLKDGWKHPPTNQLGEGRFFLTEAELQTALVRQINKNDPLDVVAYCAFARELGFNLPEVSGVRDVEVVPTTNSTPEAYRRQFFNTWPSQEEYLTVILDTDKGPGHSRGRVTEVTAKELLEINPHSFILICGEEISFSKRPDMKNTYSTYRKFTLPSCFVHFGNKIVHRYGGSRMEECYRIISESHSPEKKIT